MRLQFSGLWRNPDFVKLWAAETVSVFGSLVGRTALPFTAVLVLDASPLEMGLLASADLLPGFLVGLAAGVWVDRLPRRPILIVADIGRAALLVTIPAAYALDSLTMGQLYVVAMLVGTLTVFFDVAYQSYLPSLVRREELLEGNSALAASASVAEVGAFGTVGWLVQLLTAPVAVLVDAFSFVFSAAFVGLIRRPEPPLAAASERQSMRHEVAEGMRAIMGNPLLRALAASGVTADCAFRVFGAVFLIYVTRDLGFKPGVLGLIFAVGGVSSLLGALMAGRASRLVGLGPATIYGLVLMGVSMLFVPLAQGATAVAALLLIAQQVVGDGGATVAEINQVSVRQAVTPDRMLGRVNATVRFAGLGAMLLGALTGGLLGETVGLRATLVVGAGGLLLSALWLVVSPARTLGPRVAPAEAPAC